MTETQISYARFLEDKRHNEVTEQLTSWKNEADVALKSRDVAVSENALVWQREIQAKQQAEQERHNLATEKYSQMQAEAALSQAGAAWENARTQGILRMAQSEYYEAQTEYYPDYIKAQLFKSTPGTVWALGSEGYKVAESFTDSKPSQMAQGHLKQSSYTKKSSSSGSSYSGGGRNLWKSSYSVK